MSDKNAVQGVAEPVRSDNPAAQADGGAAPAVEPVITPAASAPADDAAARLEARVAARKVLDAEVPDLHIGPIVYSHVRMIAHLADGTGAESDLALVRKLATKAKTPYCKVPQGSDKPAIYYYANLAGDKGIVALVRAALASGGAAASARTDDDGVARHRIQIKLSAAELAKVREIIGAERQVIDWSAKTASEAYPNTKWYAKKA